MASFAGLLRPRPLNCLQQNDLATHEYKPPLALRFIHCFAVAGPDQQRQRQREVPSRPSCQHASGISGVSSPRGRLHPHRLSKPSPTGVGASSVRDFAPHKLSCQQIDQTKVADKRRVQSCDNDGPVC